MRQTNEFLSHVSTTFLVAARAILVFWVSVGGAIEPYFASFSSFYEIFRQFWPACMFRGQILVVIGGGAIRGRKKRSSPWPRPVHRWHPVPIETKSCLHSVFKLKRPVTLRPHRLKGFISLVASGNSGVLDLQRDATSGVEFIGRTAGQLWHAGPIRWRWRRSRRRLHREVRAAWGSPLKVDLCHWQGWNV